MKQFDNGVPFDPGYSQFAIYFPESIQPIMEELVLIKAPHQKKFKLSLYEAAIKKLINNCAAFYLGCILWGAYINHRFKDAPKEIINNPAENLSKEEKESRDYTEETTFILEFITLMDKNFKYFVKKPFKIDDLVIEIFEAYKEFVLLNDNFMKIKTTGDIRLPEAVKHFKKFDNKKLDLLHKRIIEVIDSGDIDKLLEIGFYN